MPPAEFEPAIPASERPKTHALDSADPVIGIGYHSDDKPTACDKNSLGK
jgi:hypothetical protein